MEKNYCDKCRKLDFDVPVMIQVSANVFKYTNHSKYLEKEFLEREDEITKHFVTLKEVWLCCDCFSSFFHHTNPEEAGKEMTTYEPPSVS